MRRSALLVLAAVSILVAAGDAGAVNTTLHALAPGQILMRGGATKKFTVAGRWFDEDSQMVNPTAATSTLRVQGTGSGDGDSGVITLPAGHWATKGKSFVFSDPSATTGISSLKITPGKHGGKLKIAGGGAHWTYAITQPQTGVQVTLSIGGAVLWQAQFPGACGAFKHNSTGGFMAETKRAPGKASTWSTIQKTIIARHGCAAAACHGSAQQGGLDLRSKVAYGNLVGVPAVGAQGENRVERGSERDSFLFAKLAAATKGLTLPAGQGSAMPFNGDKLTTDELEAVRLWIQAGAPETGSIPNTDKLLGSCLPPSGPLKIAAPPAPLASEGLQFHAPPWTIPAQGEGEVCYATYYDVDAQVPAEMKEPCYAPYFGEGKTCFIYNKSELTQDPNSHHSIIHIYLGTYPASDPGFGFACSGGAQDGQACDPTIAGVCGAGATCTGKPKSSLACLTFGPPDFNKGGNPVNGTGSDTAPAFGGSQQPFYREAYPAGVWAALPTKGIIVWNSHAFNTGLVPTTNEQYLNMFFAGPNDRQFPVRGTFDATDIFVQDVPPFEEREYCRTITYRKGTQIIDFSTHAHKRSRLFRVWGPGIAQSCRSTKANPELCKAETTPPILTTTQYNDPAQLRYDTPLNLDSDDPAQRRFKFCSIYDNGLADATKVKRNSTSPVPPTFGTLAPGGPCYVAPPNPFTRDLGISCLAGPKKGQPCAADDSVCDSSVGAGDGQCDACPLFGGVTTEDEMFILLGNYYCAANTECEGTCKGGAHVGALCHSVDAECDTTPGSGDGNCVSGYKN